MCVAVWAAVAKVAKKILAILLGDKKGRKFLGYVVGIALFIALLPFIVKRRWRYRIRLDF